MNEALKSNRGRPPATQPKDKWHVSVSMDVSIFWRMQFHDELTNAVRVGAMSELVDRLLRQEMLRLQGEAA